MTRTGEAVAWMLGLVGATGALAGIVYASSGGSSTPASTPSGSGGATAGSAAPPPSNPAPSTPPASVSTSTSTSVAPPLPKMPVGVVAKKPSPSPINITKAAQSLTLVPGGMVPHTLSVSGNQYPAELSLTGGTSISATSSTPACAIAQGSKVTAVSATACSSNVFPAVNAKGAKIAVTWIDSSGNPQTSTFNVAVVP